MQTFSYAITVSCKETSPAHVFVVVFVDVYSDVKPRHMKLLRKEIARIRHQLKLQTPKSDDTLEAASAGTLSDQLPDN